MKSLFLFCALAFLAITARAENYFTCKGQMKHRNQVTRSKISLFFKKDDFVIVRTKTGNEYHLSLDKKDRNQQIFADYELDEYGGYAELIVPGNFNPYQQREPFSVILEARNYSETRYLGADSFIGKCQSTEHEPVSE